MRAPLAVAVAVVVAVAVAGCGDGSSPQPPDGGAGPTGPTGSEGPTGPSGSGGTPAGGTPSGGGGSGGGETPGDGGGPVVSADGTVRIERLDPHAECDGLLPSRAPDSVRTTAGAEAGSCGGPGISEGGGHVALTVQSGGGWREWQAFTVDGRPEERFTLHSWRIFPQPDGWIGPRAGARSAPYGSVEVNSYFPDGTPRRSEVVERAFESPIHQWAMAEDPLGGVLLVHAWHDTDGSGTCGGDARRYDASGAPRGRPAGIGCWIVGAGVSSRGAALVLEGRLDEVWVRWIRPDGTPAGAPALEGRTEELFGAGATVDLAPLLDGSLAVSEGGRWTRRYPHLADHGEPAPAWLASRSLWTFRNTRGNRGYAFFPQAGASTGETSADCSQAVELRAPSGRLCGKVTLFNPGGPCRTGPADQGWDGTVVEKDARRACTWRWWPGLLAR